MCLPWPAKPHYSYIYICIYIHIYYMYVFTLASEAPLLLVEHTICCEKRDDGPGVLEAYFSLPGATVI